ncbi:MAG: glycosyltransferase, partial [Rhodobiaceae bacterium]|nr:glycosyltransferase [Rhodobiaceae bacterium]
MGRILHCMRAPVGGLFRHVLDLAHEQVARGHDVGIICDGSTGGAQAIKQLSDIAPDLALGVHRIAMPRLPGLGDLSAVLQTRALISRIGPDIVHGHGAKGGAYAR